MSTELKSRRNFIHLNWTKALGTRRGKMFGLNDDSRLTEEPFEGGISQLERSSEIRSSAVG